MTTSLDLPAIYQFPPLFTRQPNQSIRNKQIETWINIILTNCERRKIWTITKQGNMKIIDPETQQVTTINIFHNTSIDRFCSPIFINEIWQAMQKQGQLLNRDGKDVNMLINDDGHGDEEFFILWKSLELWANDILDWFERTTQLNKVVTFYEIVSSEDNVNESFYSMPESLLYQILKILIKRGRATMLKEDSKYVAIKVI